MITRGLDKHLRKQKSAVQQQNKNTKYKQKTLKQTDKMKVG